MAVSEGNRGNHLRVINGAGQACFESPQSMKRDFQAFKNRTAVTKEERLRQRKNCVAIDKDKAAPRANDNFLITVPFWDSFPLPFAVLCAVTKEADTMPKRRANGEGNIRKRKDGRWEGRYTVGHDPETGKAIIKNVRGKTQAGDTVKTELIYDREKVRAESCPDFSYISQKLR